MRHKMGKIRRGARISVKIAFIFVILTCIFWGILLIQFYHVSYRESMDYAETLSNQTLNTISGNITTLVDNAAYDSRLILSSSDITNSLKSGDMERQKESLYQFISLIDFETHINGIYIMDMNDHVCSIDRSSIRSFRTERLSDISWYDEVIGLEGSFCLKVNADRVLTQSTMEPMVSLIRAVINPADFQPVGILMINIDLSAFEDCYSGIDEENVRTIYILDDTGKIVTSRSEMKLPEVQKMLEGAENGKAEGSFQDQKLLFESTRIEKTGWQILIAVKSGSVFSASRTASGILFSGFEVLTVFCVISYLVMDRFVTVPLEQVVGFMNRMRGKKFEKMDMSGTYRNSYLELEVLKETYNQMVDEIDLLVDRVYEEERIKRKAELNVLQEQMKPHFLYNTIDAMSYLALSGRNEELYDALEAFGGYYRTLLSKGKELISVKEEIEMVRDYLELQKLRYGNGLNYVLDVETEMQKKYVLKMILQPFVENSVNHGIRSKGTSGSVWIKGKEKDHYFYFQVIDDGAGIREEIMEKLKSEVLDKNEKSFGVRGTIERMKIFYDSDIRYEIKSRIGKGTVIELRIPVIEEPVI